MVKMIVMDLDGTLLKTDKTISEFTKSILNQCCKIGIKIVYATGRGGSAESVAPSELFDCRITMNGAIARINDSIIYNKLIPHEIARSILIACDQRGLKTASELSGMHYSNFDVSNEWSQISNYKIVDFKEHNIDAEKLYFMVNNPDDSLFVEKQLPKELYLSVSRDGLGMIMHKDATKAKAVAEVRKIWEISQSEILAFGDDLNDIDMLKYSGISVAMENALDEVKAIADFVCLSNDEDGIANWIINSEILK